MTRLTFQTVLAIFTNLPKFQFSYSIYVAEARILPHDRYSVKN